MRAESHSAVVTQSASVTVDGTAPAAPKISATEGSLTLGVAFLIVGVGNYGFTLTLARLLPLGAFGVFALAQGFMLFAAWFTSAGFPWTAARRLPLIADAAEQAAVLRGALVGNVCLAAALGAGLLVLVATGVLKLGDQSAMPLLVVAVACSIGGMTAVTKGGLQGIFRFHAVAAAYILETVVKLAVGLGLAAAGLGATGATLGILAGLVAAAGYTLKELGGLPIARWRRAAGWWLWRETVPLFVGFAGMALLTSADLFGVKIVAPAAHSNDDAGLYTAAVTLARTPFFLATALTTAVFPYVARARADGDRRRAAAYVRKGLLHTVALLAPVSLVMLVAPAQVLALFYPAPFGEAAVALRVIAGGTLFLCLAEFLLGALQAAGDSRGPAIAVLAAVGGELLLLGVGLPIAAGHGAQALMAVAGAGYDAAAVFAAAALLVRAHRRFGLRVPVRGTVAFASAAGGLVAVLLALPHPRSVQFAAVVMLAAAVYGAVALGLGLLSRADVSGLLVGLRLARRPTRGGQRYGAG